MATHESAVGLLVRGVHLQHLLPTAMGAHHREPALAQPRARTESPLLIQFVGQQLAAVGGVEAGLDEELGNIIFDLDQQAAACDPLACQELPDLFTGN